MRAGVWNRFQDDFLFTDAEDIRRAMISAPSGS
jgi:hypothetical protein